LYVIIDDVSSLLERSFSSGSNSGFPLSHLALASVAELTF
jgi:hypothetical protein